MASYQMGRSVSLTIAFLLLGLNKFTSTYTNIPDLTDHTIGYIIMGLPVMVFTGIVLFHSDKEVLEKKFKEGQKNKSQWKLRGFLVTAYYAVSIVSALYLIYG